MIQLRLGVISEQLAELRMEKNLSQRDLAKNMNCSQNRVFKIEKIEDENLLMRQLLDYAEGLNMDVKIFLEPR